MIEPTDLKVLDKIKKAKRGSLFFIDSFSAFGKPKSVAKTLERLVKKQELYRVSTGIYTRPVIDKVVGVVLPGIEDIARAIAKRDKAKIVPTGSYALYKLGLSTQVPLNAVYYTDASARKVKVGNQNITFKKASAKNLAAIGEVSSLVIQALKEIGKDNLTAEEERRIRQLLKNERPYHLQHDAKIAPAWMRYIFQPDNAR